jgi:hypothetical protein
MNIIKIGANSAILRRREYSAMFEQRFQTPATERPRATVLRVLSTDGVIKQQLNG